MRVLLAGGAGYVGTHTAVALLDAGHEVVLLDDLSGTQAVAAARVEQITGRSAPLVVGDAADDAVVGLVDLYRRLDAPRALRDLGMPHDGIARAARAVVAAAPSNNPTPVTVENITALLEAAWKGTEPS